MEITRSSSSEKHNACAIFSIRLNKNTTGEQLIGFMSATKGVISVEEL